MSDLPESMQRPHQKTLEALQEIKDSTILKLTKLTLPEIQSIKREIARVLPAGNLPAFVLSGLLKLEGRRINSEQVRSDLAALLRGTSLVSKGLYGAFVAGPAVVLHAYQKILQLAGKDPTSAFPEGIWQFYLQFGLREDTSRHANETIGFHQVLGPNSDPARMAAAWVCATLDLLYRYDDLLAVDWGERVMLRLVLEEAKEVGAADDPPFATLIRDWQEQRPYHRPPDGSDYLVHRRGTFQQFLQKRLRSLPSAARERFGKRYQDRRWAALPAYQEQMTLLAALTPDRYQEQKEPIPLWRALIGFVWQDRTYLLPACQQDEQGSPLCYPPPPSQGAPTPLYALSGGKLCNAQGEPLLSDRAGRVWDQGGQVMGILRPPKPEVILSWLAPLLVAPSAGPSSTLDLLLVESSRVVQPQLRESLTKEAQAELAALRRAPIILNWDPRPHGLPLAYVRRGRRGIGDHALTIFRTDQSFVFDQSHIFFDGVWGMAIAAIVTDSAIHWYQQLEERPFTPQASPPQPLDLIASPAVEELARPHRQRGEAAAESEGVDTHRLHRLRGYLKQRGVHLTVNDLLLLNRFFHAGNYSLSPRAQEAVRAFQDRSTSSGAEAAFHSIETTLARLRETNPALLIPMDASNVSPRERVFPTTFRNPLTEIREQFTVARKRCQAYQADPDQWGPFDQARRELLAYLDAFGKLLDALKGVTMRGESFNTATIQLLAHLPPSMQSLMDQIPQRIGVLNEVIKGNEVFSNVGRVAPGTSLTRFISAKDDGETKVLIWGVLTDDEDRMRISLRDFRPFVPRLLALGETGLADLLAQDYLESYVEGFNRFVVVLSEVITTKGPSAP